MLPEALLLTVVATVVNLDPTAIPRAVVVTQPTFITYMPKKAFEFPRVDALIDNSL